ncbi:hypothetical protein KY290_016205 [Solanum tuberosum]|uniref:ABC-2 type transporter transmembrane domain-containing protein n=1 Tax=Solanum tuberosum TaxID=4113 RepID=A0ABQ7VUV4_SOLTU|nr:hypothetical protein KY290_016205 [Solanum tuberosum]
MDSQQDLFNAMGSMYVAVLFIGVTNSTVVQPFVSVERFVSYRERAAGMYSALPFAFAQVAIEFPQYLFPTTFMESPDSPKAKVIYWDFKSSDILLDVDGPIDRKSHVSTRAPEYMATGHITARSDVHSFGVVLLKMLTGRRMMDKNCPHGEHNLIEWAKPLQRQVCHGLLTN